MMTTHEDAGAADKVPVLVLNGFLGSGKTTLLRSLLVQARAKDLDLGVVVNDMSELDVDGDIVAHTEFFDEGSRRFRSIHSCVLSSRKGIGELREALGEMLADGLPELVVIETSGSCHPMPLVQFFADQPAFKLTGLLTLVDTAMIDQDYDCGRLILPTMQRNIENQRRDTTNLLVEQIMFCSHILLTKADRIDESRVQAIAGRLHELNPFAAVISLPWGNLPLEDIRAMSEYDYHRVQPLFEELGSSVQTDVVEERPYDLATRVIKDDRPFHPQRLWDTCTQHLGQKIYRSKGFFYLCSRDAVSLLWNQAAAGISLELVGYWRAGILEDENYHLNDEEREGLKRRLASEPGRFGDRHCHLTVIGDKSQVDQFAESLRRCFLTDDEIRRWQAGEQFPDPWPTNYETRTP